MVVSFSTKLILIYIPARSAGGGLARRSSVGATSGISSFCITACGVAGLEPWDVYDRGRVLVDNIVVTALPAGTCIIVR